MIGDVGVSSLKGAMKVCQLSRSYFYIFVDFLSRIALAGQSGSHGKFTILNGGQGVVGRNQSLQQLSRADTVTSTAQCDCQLRPV